MQREIFVTSDKAVREYLQQNPSERQSTIGIWETLAATAVVKSICKKEFEMLLA